MTPNRETASGRIAQADWIDWIEKSLRRCDNGICIPPPFPIKIEAIG
jgi:hypothetical protein